MDIYSSEELPQIREQLVERLTAGQVAIFPTDTLYGLTADARRKDAVERVLELKRRRTPVSCIPHSLEWARQLVAPEYRVRFDQNVERYFGSYTTLWPSNQETLHAHPLVQTPELVGMRWPNHWITEFARQGELPLTTTSVNLTGHPPMRSLESLAPSIKDGIDFLVYEGPLEGKASTIVHCGQEQFPTTERDR